MLANILEMTLTYTDDLSFGNLPIYMRGMGVLRWIQILRGECTMVQCVALALAISQSRS